MSDAPAPDDGLPANPAEQTRSYAILRVQIEEGLTELERPSSGLVLSALSAGLDIGFGPLLMAVILTLAGDVWSEPLLSIALANAYAVGFIFVVLGRSELFTEHTTLAVLPVLDGQATVGQLARLWGLVYAGNVAGSTMFAVLAVVAAPAYGIVDTSAFIEISTTLTEHSALGLFGAAVLAGWLMGLLSWLVAAAQETISRIFFVWLIAVTIGIAHLPHAIAGNVEVLAGLFVAPELGVLDYLRFLALATLGNAVGGAVFVSLLKYGHAVRGGS